MPLESKGYCIPLPLINTNELVYYHSTTNCKFVISCTYSINIDDQMYINLIHICSGISVFFFPLLLSHMVSAASGSKGNHDLSTVISQLSLLTNSSPLPLTLHILPAPSENPNLTQTQNQTIRCSLLYHVNSNRQILMHVEKRHTASSPNLYKKTE